MTDLFSFELSYQEQHQNIQRSAMDRLAQTGTKIKSIEIKVIQGQLSEILTMIEDNLQQEQRIDLVERGLFSSLLDLGAKILQLFIDKSGDGDVGQSISTSEGLSLERSQEKQIRRYQSIFGDLEVERYVYWKREKQKALVKPLDKKLALPENDQSYVLEDWLQRLVVKETYVEGVTSLKTLLNLTTSVRSAERMNRDMAQAISSFEPLEDFHSQPDAELLVVTADGKGVPMRQSLNEKKHEKYGTKLYERQNTRGVAKTEKRRTAGANKSTKQSAYVGAVYSIAPFVRSVGDVLNELQRAACQTDRPRPVHKRLSVEMTQVQDELQEGPQQLFTSLAAEVDQRAGNRQVICLMDGQRSLWYRQRESLPKAIPILDLFHAMEYLWEAAYCFEDKGSVEAEKFVHGYLRMLLEGKVKNVIAMMKRKKQKLAGNRRKTLEKVIRYYTTNLDHMKYDQYLAAGYPIGSGVIEGACRHLVKDRMERSGMRWTIEGATSVLKLRAIYLNHHWDQFLEHRIKTEQNQLYANAA
jgi:hypothetical protein